MSDVDLIQKALLTLRGHLPLFSGDPQKVARAEAHERLYQEAAALLDGVTGFARAGAVILSAEQADNLSGGISAICAPLPECRALRDKLLALLASERPGEEQA